MAPFWQDQKGFGPSSNWFKEHPKATLALLLIVLGVIVLVST